VECCDSASHAALDADVLGATQIQFIPFNPAEYDDTNREKEAGCGTGDVRSHTCLATGAVYAPVGQGGASIPQRTRMALTSTVRCVCAARVAARRRLPRSRTPTSPCSRRRQAGRCGLPVADDTRRAAREPAAHRLVRSRVVRRCRGRTALRRGPVQIHAYSRIYTFIAIHVYPIYSSPRGRTALRRLALHGLPRGAFPAARSAVSAPSLWWRR
jgi:hypothetical protein